VRPLADVTPSLLRAATDEISALIEDRLPLHFDPGEQWPLIGHAFLARAGTLLESLTILVEHGQSIDAQILLRVLYEHVTTFCWIATDPEKHVKAWKKWSDGRRKARHNHASDFGIEVLTSAELAKIGEPPGLPQLAREVDLFWPNHSEAFVPLTVEGPNKILTFSGIYVAVYRKGSNFVHADVAAVDRFLSSSLKGSGTAHATEMHVESPDYPALGLALVGLLLIAFAYHFAWPDENLVRRITDGILYEN
jgi:Family of unknown function (DUF5677)